MQATAWAPFPEGRGSGTSLPEGGITLSRRNHARWQAPESPGHQRDTPGGAEAQARLHGRDPEGHTHACGLLLTGDKQQVRFDVTRVGDEQRAERRIGVMHRFEHCNHALENP